MTSEWRPGATNALLKQRAQLNRLVREFFFRRDVMEVETPLLCQAPVTDPNIDPIEAQGRYLHTSPEYAMKRLLCAGSGDIYQICKVFRSGEAGQRHNPEFTMLEWYRVGWNHHQLMDEVQLLLEQILAERVKRRITLTYHQALNQYARLDLSSADEEQIKQLGISLAGADLELNRDGWLDIIMSHAVEPELPPDTLVFIHDYPASQAALAKVRCDKHEKFAERFEVYFNGIELANGYHELTDAVEQQVRFEKEAQGRPIDERLIGAMAEGMPACAGVAIGLDRILMVLSEIEVLDKVVSFSWNRA